jgi:hypothetical protein
VPEVVRNPDLAGLQVALGGGSGGDEVDGRAGGGGGEDRRLSGGNWELYQYPYEVALLGLGATYWSRGQERSP